SPGVFFDHDKGKTHSSGKYLFAARVIPYRGSWLDFEFDAKDLVYVRIDRRRKLPVTTLLYALDSLSTEKLRGKRAKDGRTLDPQEVQGMSAEEILNFFYDTQVFLLDKKGWTTEFDAQKMKGMKLNFDLVDAKTGRVKLEAGGKLSPRIALKLEKDGLKELRVQPEELVGKYIAEDVVNTKTGEIYIEAGEEITADTLKAFDEAEVDEVKTLFIDGMNVGPYLRNTLARDKNTNRDEALVDIYRVMRPGEPPTLETAEALFQGLFFDAERYDLSTVGRVKMNARLNISNEDVPDSIRHLRKDDILRIIKVLVELKDGRGEIDDIDHLGNRRVRSVGELMENQYRVGLLRMERAIRERMSSVDID